MISNYCLILPFWPLKTTKSQNYFLYPLLLAKEAGYNVSLFVHSDHLSQPKRIDGILLTYYRSVVELERALPEAAHVHIQTSNREMLKLLVFLTCLKKQRTLLWTPHTSFNLHNHPFNSRLNVFVIFNLFIRRFDKIFCISPYEVEYLNRLGITHTCFLPLIADSTAFKTSFKRTSRPLRMVFIGGDRPIKGLVEVLKACSILTKLHIPYSLFVIGEVLQGFKFKYRSLISPKIIFLGQLTPTSSRIHSILQSCHIYINNSFCEGTPLAAYEVSLAQIAGCMSDLPTVRSVFLDSVLYHNPTKPTELVANILHYYYNPIYLNAQAKKAFKKIKPFTLYDYKKKFIFQLNNI